MCRGRGIKDNNDVVLIFRNLHICEEALSVYMGSKERTIMPGCGRRGLYGAGEGDAGS